MKETWAKKTMWTWEQAVEMSMTTARMLQMKESSLIRWTWMWEWPLRMSTKTARTRQPNQAPAAKQSCYLWRSRRAFVLVKNERIQCMRRKQRQSRNHPSHQEDESQSQGQHPTGPPNLEHSLTLCVIISRRLNVELSVKSWR